METNAQFSGLSHFFTEQDLQKLLDRIPEPLCLLNSNEDGQPFQFVYANAKAEEFLKLPAEELCTFTWAEVFGTPLEGTLEELKQKSKDQPIEYKESPLAKQLKGHALKVSIEDFYTVEGSLYFVLTIVDATDHLQTKEKLLVTMSEFESLFKYTPFIVYSINREGHITNLNDAGLQILKYSPYEIIGMKFKDVIVDADLERTEVRFLSVLEGNVENFFITIEDKFGQPISVEITAVPIIIDGELTGVIGTAQDITKRLSMEQKLKESEESHRAFFDYNIDPVITYDLEGRFLTCNKATEELLGAQPEELQGQSFLSFIDEEVRDQTWYHFQQVLKGRPYQYETVARNRQNEEIFLHITLIPAFVNNELTHIHCIGKDITLQKQHVEMMRYMAYHDNLTGLGNQRLFNEDLRKVIQQEQELSVWIVDLDRFKFINDHLGHEAGDQLLMRFAKRLQDVLGDRGNVYRYGGDEFAVLTPGLSELETKVLAVDVVHEIGKSFEVDGFSTVLTASIGISFYPRHGVDEKEIVRSADHAMYHAKKHGRNMFQIYSSDIQGLAYVDLRMETLLHEALKNNEFVLHYQPQYLATTGEVHGVEALIRWNNPELGIVSPAAFIPIAEETGMIVPIGEWVVEEACRQNVAWQKAGMPPVPVSVNLSLRQFYQMDLAEKIAAILTKTGLQPHYLMLEITETIAMQEDIASGILQKLKKIGVKIAMDDFGTGYSSLKYLQSFSIDHIKIDKAFIDNLSTKEGKAIVATIISLGHHLDMTVVAEGVETPTQVAILKDLGCHVFQGYYFSRPVPPEVLENEWHLS